jgi:hypothetical protein
VRETERAREPGSKKDTEGVACACVGGCVRACVSACVRACVSACVRACVSACVRAFVQRPGGCPGFSERWQ